MLGLDAKVMEHRLAVDPKYRPVREKVCNHVLERQKVIVEEVDKLLKARFIQEVTYPNWVSNVVLVKKANDK